MKKRVIILGAGTFQKGLINFLKANNLFVIGITNKPNEISASACDEIINVSYTNTEKTIEIFKAKNSLQAFSIGSDAALLTQAKIHSNFNLEGNSISTVLFYLNKWNYKKKLNLTGLTPKTIFLEKNKSIPKEVKSSFYKCILKPPQGSGSANVFKIKEYKDLEETIKCLSSNYLLEEFYNGTELGCNLFIYRNKIHYHAPTKKTVNDYFVPDSHLILSSNKLTVLKPFLEKVKKSLSLKDGFYNLDIIHFKNKFFLIDISPRLGGNCMSKIIALGYGFNEFNFLKKWLFKEDITCINISFKKNVGVYIINSNKEGILESKDELANTFKKNKIELFWNKKIGDSIKVFNKGSNHLGYFIFTASSDKELVALLEKIKTHKWFTLQRNSVHD